MMTLGDNMSDTGMSGSEEWVEDAADDAAELELTDDESLPWLEADEYDQYESGVEPARIIGFGILLVLLAAVVVGGLYWLTSRNEGANAVPDGSTIEAPVGDYKERPDDAGGKEFAGTGSVAPAVGEGQTREGTLSTGDDKAGGNASATNSGTETGTGTGGANGSGETSEAASATGGVGVQVGAYGTTARAEKGWSELRGQSTALNGVRHRVVKGQADIGTVYRLQAVVGDVAAADALCRKLKADGLACQVKR